VILKQAIARHQAGDVAGAIDGYRAYLKQRPDSPLALINLGAAYAHEGRYEEAIVEYQRALKIQPENGSARLNLALAYYKTGRVDSAAVELDQVHRAAPGELQPVLLLADCWLAMGENKKVIALLDPVWERRTDDLAITYLLGTALVRDEQFSRGQALIDRILRNGNSAETWLLLGTAKLKAGDFPAALADLEKAIELNPNLPGVQSFYGETLMRTGDPGRAAAAFRQALAADPFDYTANLQLAILLAEDEKYDEAAPLFEHALRVRPRDLAVRYQIAATALRQEKLDAAQRDLEAIVKEAPAYTEAHVALATVYYRLKRKTDGDRERAIVQKLNEEKQAKQAAGLNVK
jgi:tetratricopeptide (TPR) repeat protein